MVRRQGTNIVVDSYAGVCPLAGGYSKDLSYLSGMHRETRWRNTANESARIEEYTKERCKDQLVCAYAMRPDSLLPG